MATVETIVEMALSGIHESPTNPRKRYDPVALAELTASVQAHGVLQPIRVRGVAATGKKAGGWEIIVGSRRFRAAQAAGLERIPAIACDMDDAAVQEIQAIENAQREDLTPLEEADAFAELLGKLGSYEQVAARTGKDPKWIARTIVLVRLTPQARKAVEAGTLSVETARILAPLTDADQGQLLKVLERFDYAPGGKRRVIGYGSAAEARSYRDRDMLRPLDRAPWDLADAELVKAAGACTVCPKRTGAQVGMFAEVTGDQCADGVCFQGKMKAFLAAAVTVAATINGKAPVLVSDEHYTRMEKVLDAGKYLALATNAAGCASTEPAVVVESLRGKIGRILSICRDRTCKVHSATARRSPAERAVATKGRAQRKAQETARKVREAVFRAGIAKVTAVDLGHVAERLFERTWHDARDRVIKVLGWAGEVEIQKGKQTGVGAAWQRKQKLVAAGEKYVARLKGGALAQAVMALAMADDLYRAPDGRTDPILTFAKTQGVDVAKVQREMVAAAKPKAKRAKGVPAKTAKGKKRKAAAA